VVALDYGISFFSYFFPFLAITCNDLLLFNSSGDSVIVFAIFNFKSPIPV